MNPTNVTFIDLETTGLDPEVQEITELAAIKTVIDEGVIHIVDQKEFKVMPEYPVDPFVAKLNGYSEEVWAQQSVDYAFAVGEIIDMMRGSWHAGSNPKFDESFLKKAVKELHWSYPRLASYHLIDVSVMAFPLFLQGKVEKLKQEALAKYYEIGGGGHRAMADALQCCEIFAKINNLTITRD